MTLSEELRASYNPRVAEALATATKSAPFPTLLGFVVVEQRPGYIACKIPVGDRHKNGIGLVHGGVLTALIDHVLSVVVYPHVEVGKWVATLDLQVSYLAPVHDGELLAEAEIVSLRRRIGSVRINVRNVGGPPGSEPELVAAAMGNVYVKDPPGRST
jgi:uncharacterized protein (TIGR00369 family)